MKTFIGTKQVQAEPMNLGDYNNYRGWIIPQDEDPNREGYLVRYSDSYVSWSPKEAFEESYREINALTFGQAIELLKQGKKVARAGWNGKGMFVFLQKGHELSKALKYGYGEYENEPVMNDCLILKGVNNQLNTWVASISDTLAEDWTVVE